MQGCKRKREEASGQTYDVFISHAGPQKATFAVWMRRELRRHGVSAFLDERSLKYGDAAGVEMEAALRSCSIVVVVLTPDFVRSNYCMKELHWALHPSHQHPAQLPESAEQLAKQAATGSESCKDARSQQTTRQRSKNPPLLLPVLYHTSDMDSLQQDIQRQIAEAHTNGASAAELQRLQQASTDLAAAYEFTANRLDSQGKLDDVHVDAIVAEVLRRLDRPAFEAPTYAVDLDSRVQALLALLQPDQPGGVLVLSLHGMGGIGKTTLAKELFSRLSSGSCCFSTRIFLEVGQGVTLVDKQQELLQLLTGSPMSHVGVTVPLQQQLERCTSHAGPLLLVLDDIWETGQRDTLLCLDALSDGSRVIVTGRDGSKLHPDGGGCLLRAVEELERSEAAQLLCHHAFAAQFAPPEYAAAVARALDVCGGLPLALQVVGAGMRSRSPQAAEDSIRKLLATPGPDVGRYGAAGGALDMLTILQRSWSQLPTDNHRQLFLDAALIMRGHPKEHLLLVWARILQQQDDDGLQQPPTPAHWRDEAEELWNVCAAATLVTCRSAPDDAIYSRVQVHDCMVEMARAVGKGLSHATDWSLSRLSPTTRLPQAGSLQAQAPRLLCGPAGAAHAPAWTITQLLTSHQRCQLAALDLPHDLAESSGRALSPASSTRVDLPPELLYLRSPVAPHHWAFGGELLVLEVSGRGMCELPDSIAACSALRHLKMCGSELRCLPASIGSLISLEALLLSGSRRLAELPSSITCLQRLQHLDLTECNSLRKLPEGLGSLTTLKLVQLRWCWQLQQLPDSIGSLSSMELLDLSCCHELQQLPDSIGRLCSLKTLDISCCWKLQHLPDSMGSLARLERLDVSDCEALQQLPDSLGSLSNLVWLGHNGCKALQQLPDSMSNLVSSETHFPPPHGAAVPAEQCQQPCQVARPAETATARPLPCDADRSRGGVPGGPTLGAPSSASDEPSDELTEKLPYVKKQRRWLLLLPHCAKCQAPMHRCQYGRSCMIARQLWRHLTICSEMPCPYPRCTGTRELLKHHLKCTSSACPVCTRAPVKQIVRNQRPQLTASMITASSDMTVERSGGSSLW